MLYMFNNPICRRIIVKSTFNRYRYSTYVSLVVCVMHKRAIPTFVQTVVTGILKHYFHCKANSFDPHILTKDIEKIVQNSILCSANWYEHRPNQFIFLFFFFFSYFPLPIWYGLIFLLSFYKLCETIIFNKDLIETKITNEFFFSQKILIAQKIFIKWRPKITRHKFRLTTLQ